MSRQDGPGCNVRSARVLCVGLVLSRRWHLSRGLLCCSRNLLGLPSLGALAYHAVFVTRGSLKSHRAGGTPLRCIRNFVEMLSGQVYRSGGKPVHQVLSDHLHARQFVQQSLPWLGRRSLLSFYKDGNTLSQQGATTNV